jgi:tRNA (mo5U34)-methyltransferase
MDANNMYVLGAPEERAATDRRAAGVIEAAPEAVRAGVAIDLPCRHRDHQPDLRAKDLRPVSFPELGPGSSRAEIERAVAWVDDLVGWFHSVDLPQGVRTPGGRGWETRGRVFDIAGRVRGKRVLDLGAMEGGDSFHAEDCAASEVVACDVDNYYAYDLGRNAAWDFVVEKHLEARAKGPEHEWAFLNAKRLGFELCRTLRGSSVTRVSGSVYDLAPETHGVFDVTYCFGLLYHLRHPLLALDRIASVTRGCVLVNNQTLDDDALDRHCVRFFNDTWRGAYTNWFVPSRAAFLDMLSSAGFRRLEVVDVTATSTSVVCHV